MTGTLHGQIEPLMKLNQMSCYKLTSSSHTQKNEQLLCMILMELYCALNNRMIQGKQDKAPMIA